MASRSTADSKPAYRKSTIKPTTKINSEPASSDWAQHVLLFACFFAGLMLLHAPLLRLPYFWDEAGYYIPAARDLWLLGTLIPRSTPSNAHPPVVMAWLALNWRLFGYSILVTRTAMIGLSAFSLVGLFRLCRAAGNLPVAWSTVLLVAIYPVYFTQSSMAQVDLAAAGFTFWGLSSYLKTHDVRRAWKYALWFSLAALTKETAILAPLALLSYELTGYLLRGRGARWADIFAVQATPKRTLALLFPIVPLAAWFAYHFAVTGYLFGNPEFFRYNVASTLNPARIPFSFAMRLWQLFGYFSLYLLTLAALLAMFRPARNDRGVERPRIPFSTQAALLFVVLAYLGFMSLVGGAVLARYMLPVLPLVILALVATIWRRIRYWKLVIALVAIAFGAGLFVNPPYGFTLEDNLAYRDYVLMHVDASRFLAVKYPGRRVLTAWPASDELSRPWLGYVSRPFPVVRVEDFSAAQIDLAGTVRQRFDVALVFSTKYVPAHPFFDNFAAWTNIKQKFFGYHEDLQPEDIARRLGGTVSYSNERNGQSVAVIAF